MVTLFVAIRQTGDAIEIGLGKDPSEEVAASDEERRIANALEEVLVDLLKSAAKMTGIPAAETALNIPPPFTAA